MLRSGRWQRLAVAASGLSTPGRSCRAMSSAAAEALEELIAHATQQDVRPAGRQREISRRLQNFQPSTPIKRVPQVHATAVVHPNAELGPNALIGPYSVIGPDVVLEADVHLQSHVVIDGKTRVGNGTVVHPFASLGGEPQDKKHRMFAQDDSRDVTLIIGSNCVIREHVTVHGSTSYSKDPTSVGDDCWLLCGAHVAHDSQLGKRVVVSNNVCIAGHVSIGDGAIIGGQVGIKQHVSIGPLAMVGGQSAVDGDVLPYGLVVGNRAKLAGLNLVGLRRAGVTRSDIKLLLRVYRYIFGAPACKKTGFAPALDLAYRETVVERAMEAKEFLIAEGLDSERRPKVHEMVDFVLESTAVHSSKMESARIMSGLIGEPGWCGHCPMHHLATSPTVLPRDVSLDVVLVLLKCWALEILTRSLTMGKKALKLDSPSDGKSAKKKSSTPRTKGRPRKSMMRQHRRQSLEAESPEQPHSPQVESPLLKPDEEDTQQTTRRSKGDKPSQRALTSLQWPKRGKSDNNNASAEVHQNGPRPTTTARRPSIMSWRSRNSTASVVEEAPRPLSCQPSSCFIGSLNGTTNEMHLPLLTKQTKARLNALKAAPKQRQLEVTIERSDELPFGAYSHPQVRVHIVDRCTGRAICPVQMTKEAKFCVSSDKNTSCTNAFDWQQTLGISVDIPALLSPRTVLLFEILETKLPSKGTRFRRGKQFESVSTHDDDDEYRHSPGTSSASEYRRIAWGFFHAITNKGTPTMNSFVLPHVADAKESEAVKKPSIVDVCGLRVRLFQYQVVTWMDSYQAKLQWGWRKNHPTMPAVFLQYQKRSRVPAPSTLHIQLKAASPLASPRQTGIPESQETTDVAPDNEQESNNASIDPESGGGDNQEQPADALLPDAREVESKIASNVTNGTPNVVFDLIAPCKRNPSEPCLIPQRVLCSLPTGKRGCSAVSFSICGRYLAASVSPDLGEFVIRVYQMASAELFAVGRGHRGVIYSLEWTTTSTGQSRILSASSDGTVRLWEIPTNAPSPQGSPRVSAFRYPRLLSLVFQWHHFPCFVYCAIFLPGSNGDIVLTGASDGCMRFRKESLVPNGQPEYGSVHVSSVAVHTICVDSKSGRVFCGDANGYITVWSRVSSALSFYEYTLIKTIHTGQTSITSLQLHPRKAHLLAHTQPNAIFQYELRSYLLLNKSYAGVVCESLLVKSTFSPDGKLVISGSEDGVPRLFASIHGQQLQRGVWGTHLFHGSPVLDVSWSPTAHVAALCSYGGDNPIVVLCSYRDDKDAVFIDESATTTISSATPSIQQLAVDAFRAGNQQDVLTGDHAQRLQRALERRRQRLQSKLSLETQASREPTSSAAV